jgi:NitT/TauT family transport system ATP-binding protein
MTTIAIKGVVQEYPDSTGKSVNRILDPVNVTFEGPSINMIMGRSGCGKSTLLRMLGGVRPQNVKTPTLGEITIDGKPIVDKYNDAVTVFQQPVNRPDLTVRQNVAFPFSLALYKKIPKLEVKDRVEAAIKAVGLADKADRYPSQLSGGQNQRLMLARGLVTKPKILLMDEPFSALDPVLRLEMQKLLIDIWNKYPCLIIMVTHDVSEAVALGDRILVLSGSPAHVVFDAGNPPQQGRGLNPDNPSVHAAVSAALK